MQKNLVGFVSLIFVLQSCSTFWEKRRCAEINWYEFGYQRAAKGESPRADPQYQKCAAIEDAAALAEAEFNRGETQGRLDYCSSNTAFRVGAEGGRYNLDFCASDFEVGPLQARYDAGLKAYCSEEGGRQAGATGKKYTMVCEGAAEEAFLAGYRPARKIYLEEKIEVAQDELKDTDRQIRRLERSVDDQALRLVRLEPMRTRSVRVDTVDSKTGLRNSHWEQEVNPEIQRNVDDLNRQLGQDRKSLDKLRKDRKKKADSIRSMRRDLRSL